jgi:hypothetical protein
MPQQPVPHIAAARHQLQRELRQPTRRGLHQLRGRALPGQLRRHAGVRDDQLLAVTLVIKPALQPGLRLRKKASRVRKMLDDQIQDASPREASLPS